MADKKKGGPYASIFYFLVPSFNLRYKLNQARFRVNEVFPVG